MPYFKYVYLSNKSLEAVNCPKKSVQSQKNSTRSLVGLNRDCSRDDLKYENKFKNGIFFFPRESLHSVHLKPNWISYMNIFYSYKWWWCNFWRHLSHMWPFSQEKSKIQLTILLTGVDLRGLKTVLILFLSRMIVLNGTNDFDMMFRLCDFYYFGAFLCW